MEEEKGKIGFFDGSHSARFSGGSDAGALSYLNVLVFMFTNILPH